MKRMSRVAALMTAFVLAVIGAATAASASYSSNAQPQVWVADGPVHAIVTSGSLVYVGGSFTGGIAALNASDGSLVWSTPADADVRALAMSADGTRLLVGGAFVTVDGETHRHLASLSAVDGSVDRSWKASAGGNVRDLVVDGDTLYLAGAFAAVNGVSQRGLGAVLVSTGTRVSTFNASTNKIVYGLAKAGSRLIASGTFATVNGQPRNSLAAFALQTGDLTSWAPPRMCSSCLNYWDIAVDQTNVYVGSSGDGGQVGAFNLTTGLPPWKYVHADGDVQAVTVTNGLVYIGGHFGRFVGSSANSRTQLAAVNTATGIVDPDFHPRMYTTYPGVWALAATPNSLYAGGNFTGAGIPNNHAPYFAAFPAGSTPPPLVLCLGQTATIVGSTGSETITGTPGADVIAAGLGDDTINGLGGDDVICGEGGVDQIDGGNDNDRLNGGAGTDTIIDLSGTDVLEGSGGSDTLNALDSSPGDTLNGGADVDTCRADGGDAITSC